MVCNVMQKTVRAIQKECRVMQAVAGLLLALFMVGCATSPTGRNQFIMVDDAQLDAQGKQVFMQMKQQQPVLSDPVVNQRVNCIAHALLSQLPQGLRDGWEVRVFNDDTPNAFALPGRKIGVFTGMLKLVQNDAQLAAVIGHEIAHVQARHSGERASMGMVSQLGQGVAETVSPGSGRLVNLGSQLGILLPYSRAHESEADIMGQTLMAQAGFDPRASIDLWMLMQRQNKGAGAPPSFLSTHPANGDRIQVLNAYLEKTMPLYQRAKSMGNVPRC